MARLPARYFSDIDLNFTRHPVTGDVALLTNHSAITQAMKNLLLMGHYEKPFHPEIGSNIGKLLFELMNATVTAALEEEIRNTLMNFEPRVILERLKVTPNYDANRYDIDLTYSINNTQTPVTVQFFLERLR